MQEESNPTADSGDTLLVIRGVPAFATENTLPPNVNISANQLTELCNVYSKVPDVKSAYTFARNVACNYKPDTPGILNTMFCGKAETKDICDALPKTTSLACSLLSIPYETFSQELCKATWKNCTDDPNCITKVNAIGNTCTDKFWTTNFQTPPRTIKRAHKKWCAQNIAPAP